MSKYAKLFAGQDFKIELEYAFAYLGKIESYRKMGFNLNEHFAEIKKVSSVTDFISENGEVYDTVYRGRADKKGSIAQIRMDGPMMMEDPPCSEGMVSWERTVRGLFSDKNVDGILVRVNTGGGQATAADLVHNLIGDRNKPVVVQTGYMASAGVEGFVKADEIILESEGSSVGSIGVVSTIPKKGLEKYVRNNHIILADTSPDKLKPYLDLAKGDDTLLKSIVNRIDKVFMDNVKRNRPLKGNRATIRETLSGGMFMGKDAKNRGLVDSIGSTNFAIKRLRRHIKNS